MKNTAYILILLWISTGSVYSQNPQLVVDFNEGPEDSFDQWNYSGVNLADHLVFPINSAEFGQELAVLTDGQLSILRDINPGIEGSEPTEFTHFKDRIYFAAYDEEHRQSLWVTDGTSGGTMMFFDPGESLFERPQGFTVVGDYMYFSYDETVFKTDGTTTSEIYSGVDFEFNGQFQSPTFCKYLGGIAFLQKVGSEIRLMSMQDDQVSALTNVLGVSSFPKLYGMHALGDNLMFSIDDTFAPDATGTYVYNAASGILTPLMIDGAPEPIRRVIKYTNEKAIVLVLGKGYYATDGFDDGELLHSSSVSSTTQGEISPSAVYQDQIVFVGDGGTFGDSYLVLSEGSALSSQQLVEVGSYNSKFITFDNYAIMATDISNNFTPTLHMVDFNAGSSEVIYDFDKNSLNGPSVLPLGVQKGNLYFLSNLDPAIGRELYSISLSLPVSTFDDSPIDSKLNVNFNMSGIMINHTELQEVQLKIYDISGRLLEKKAVSTNTWIEIVQEQVVIIQVSTPQEAESFKFIKSQ